jgi:hypothetical protein
MRITWRSRSAGEIEYGLIYGAIAILAMVAARLLPLGAFLPPCTFRALTGFSCPACGSTRALASLAQGEVLASAAFNPLCSAVIAAAVSAFLVNGIMLFLRLPRPSFSLTAFEAACVRSLTAVLVLMNWAYVAFHL